MIQKQCKVCKEVKTVENFYKSKTSFHSLCKPCYSDRENARYKESRVERLQSMKNWKVNNAEKYAANRKNYDSIRSANDLDFKLRRNLRSRLNMALKRGYKSGSAVRDLGCSIEELRAHLQSQFQVGMSWNNYGLWQIDHKVPLCKFDLTDAEQFKSAVHFSNLQPLWAQQNQSKGSR